MTCVVGIITPKSNVIMAADSANGDGYDAYTIMKNQKKIFKIGNGMLIGVSGSARVGQILNHDFDVPTDKYKDPFTYLIKDFIPALKNRLKDEFNEKETLQGSHLLIGYKGRLFRMVDNYSILESADDYDSIGVGRYNALGALYALKQTNSVGCKEMANLAVGAAIHGDINIKPPIVVESSH